MEKNQNNLEPLRAANSETLWELFEKTGSVQAYLNFVEKTKKTAEPALRHSLS